MTPDASLALGGQVTCAVYPLSMTAHLELSGLPTLPTAPHNVAKHLGLPARTGTGHAMTPDASLALDGQVTCVVYPLSMTAHLRMTESNPTEHSE
jgi:hypothetical protein